MSAQQWGVILVAAALVLAAAALVLQERRHRKRARAAAQLGEPGSVAELDEYLCSVFDSPLMRARLRRPDADPELVRQVDLARSRSVGVCGHQLPGYGDNAAATCDLAAGHPGWHQNDAGTSWSHGTPAQDEALETAAQLLHERRHRAGTAPTCGRCRADVQTIAPAFGWPA